MTKFPKINPCPVCGNHDLGDTLCLREHNVLYNGGSYTSHYSISCHECGVEIFDEYLEDLLKVWNKEETDD